MQFKIMLYLKEESVGFCFFKIILKPIIYLFNISLAIMCQRIYRGYFSNRRHFVEKDRFEKLHLVMPSPNFSATATV